MRPQRKQSLSVLPFPPPFVLPLLESCRGLVKTFLPLLICLPLLPCAALACSRCVRTQPRGGTHQQAHACSKLHERTLTTDVPVLSSRVFSRPAGRSVWKRMIKFRSRKAPPHHGSKPFVTSLDQFLILSVHHDFLDHFFSCIATLAINFVKLRLQFSPNLLQHRQGPNCKLSCGATMVPAQDTWFAHRSDSPVLPFWTLEFSMNDDDVCTQRSPTAKCRTVPNPSRTIPNAAVASDLNRHVATQTEVIHNRLQFHPFCRCSHHRCQFGLPTAQGQDSHGFGPRLHKLTAPHRHSSHCRFSRGIASSKVCVAKHLNIAVQLGPCISAGHSRVPSSGKINTFTKIKSTPKRQTRIKLQTLRI